MNNMMISKLKGHERPITNIEIDKNNNILSCSKDAKLVIWKGSSNNKLKIINCSGALWSIGLNNEFIYTGSADGMMTLWNYDGENINSYNESGPIRYIGYNDKQKIYYFLSKKLLKIQSKLSILNNELHKLCDIDLDIEHNKAVLLNDKIICGGTDGVLRIYSYNNDKLNLIESISVHKSEITDIQIDYDKNILVTSSYDCNIKIFNINTFEYITTYHHSVSILSFSIHPTLDIIAIGGGQDKMNVANSKDNGKFDIVLINSNDGNKLFEFDSKHFGPINTVSFNLDDKGIVTGGEDGYIHIWKCDRNWIKNGIIEFSIFEFNKMKETLETIKKEYTSYLGKGKETKNKRRNLKKRIDKLEINIPLKEKEINEYNNNAKTM